MKVCRSSRKESGTLTAQQLSKSFNKFPVILNVKCRKQRWTFFCVCFTDNFTCLVHSFYFKIVCFPGIQKHLGNTQYQWNWAAVVRAIIILKKGDAYVVVDIQVTSVKVGHVLVINTRRQDRDEASGNQHYASLIQVRWFYLNITAGTSVRGGWALWLRSFEKGGGKL